MRRVHGLELAVPLMAAACAGSLPQTHYYQLAPAALELAQQPRAGVLSIEGFDADAMYRDERIVYRSSPYRVDYYVYQRWVAPPPSVVTDYVRDAYARTGLFQAVVNGASATARATLTGHLTGFEEVDRTPALWLGGLRLDLELSDPNTGEVLWTRRFDESEPIQERSPEGLARALSIVMRRVVQSSAPEVARAMARQPTP